MTFTEAVDSLGTELRQVHALLEEKGIKGYRNSPTSCPVAKYLNSCGFPDVSVCLTASYFEGEGKWATGSIFLPKGVREFLCAFDSGKFPEFDIMVD